MDATAQAAIRASDDIFPADDLRVAHDSIGYDLWMLDDVGGMADHAWNEQFAVGQLPLPPHTPFVLVSDVARLHRVRTSIDGPAGAKLLDRPCQSGARGEHSGNTGCAIEGGAVTVQPRSPAARMLSGTKSASYRKFYSPRLGNDSC